MDGVIESPSNNTIKISPSTSDSSTTTPIITTPPTQSTATVTTKAAATTTTTEASTTPPPPQPTPTPTQSTATVTKEVETTTETIPPIVTKGKIKKSKKSIKKPTIVKRPTTPIDYKQWHTEWPIHVYSHPINGRYLVATKDLDEQTVILRDLPYTWAVDHATCDSVCQHCFLEVPLNQQILPTDFYMCEGCQRVGYCSANCRCIDYSQHRFECQIFKELDTEEYSPFLMSEIKLLVRTLSRKWLEDSITQTAGIDINDETIKKQNTYNQYKNPQSLIPQDNGLRYNDYAELVSNVENYNESLKESLSYWICKYVVKLSAKLGKIEDEFDLLNILLRNRCNAFYIQGRPRDGSSGESRGCGVYVRNSFFNHSCDPNVNYWVVNNTLEVECTLLKNVKEGDELTISYIDTTSPLNKRREKLLEGYLFNCLCTKCVADESLPLDQTGTLEKDDDDNDDEKEKMDEDDDEKDDDINNKNDKKSKYKSDGSTDDEEDEDNNNNKNNNKNKNNNSNNQDHQNNDKSKRLKSLREKLHEKIIDGLSIITENCQDADMLKNAHLILKNDLVLYPVPLIVGTPIKAKDQLKEKIHELDYSYVPEITIPEHSIPFIYRMDASCLRQDPKSQNISSMKRDFKYEPISGCHGQYLSGELLLKVNFPDSLKGKKVMIRLLSMHDSKYEGNINISFGKEIEQIPMIKEKISIFRKKDLFSRVVKKVSGMTYSKKFKINNSQNLSIHHNLRPVKRSDTTILDHLLGKVLFVEFVISP